MPRLYFMLIVSLGDKNSSALAQKGHRETNLGGSPNNTLPQLLAGHHRSHQPIKGSSPQAQRGTGGQRQTRTRIMDSGDGTPTLGPSQGCPRTRSAPWSRCGTHHHKSMPELLWGLLPGGVGQRERAFGLLGRYSMSI